MRQQLIAFASFVSTVTTLKCMQCTGWTWTYPGTQASPCDNMNNQCTADNNNMCVRTTDPMRPGANYETFKLDCWSGGSTIQVLPNQPQPVASGQCFNTQDGSNPPRRQKVCFCNNADWCNGVETKNFFIYSLIFLMAFYFTL
ncbi:unnamed protein product, partial [Mesorhabditis belari]|uniref:Protein quiver n=1 Tax=Mesorhabditis belari TaxID=2138241 RepID=A0AAF3EZA9_9BILA